MSDDAPRWLIDGRPGEAIRVDDRGLHYADGLFETCAVSNGRIPLWARHLRRLREGCRRLALPFPSPRLLDDEAARLCAAAPTGILKLILTRGAGARGYRPAPRPVATRILRLTPYPPDLHRRRATGVRVRLCRTRLARQPLLAGLKHLGRLEQVLARAEWDDPAIAEGLMLDTEGDLIEATQANVFLVRDGRIVTPVLARAGVSGVMRGLILDRAPSWGFECRAQRCSPRLLDGADEVFLSNAVIGLWPVVRYGRRAYPIGPVTRRVIRALAAEFPPLAQSSAGSRGLDRVTAGGGERNRHGAG